MVLIIKIFQNPYQMASTKIEIQIPEDVQIFCKLFEIEPEYLLKQYMQDLCSMESNGGSDERMMAKQYFLRTYLARQTEFTVENAEQICDDFETLYQAAYPAVGNPGWEKQRQKLLKILHQDWTERKRPVTS